MPLSAITLVAEKACCQIEDIIGNKFNKETVSLKDKLTQAVAISLYFLLLQSYCDPPSGRFRLYSKAIKSSKTEIALLVCWVKLSLWTLALL